MVVPEATASDSLLIALPPNPRSSTKIDFRPWIGQGFDEWVVAFAATVHFLLQSETHSIASIIGMYSSGMKRFFPFLTDGPLPFPPRRPEDLRAYDLQCFISALKVNYPTGSTAKNYYTALKTTLRSMHEYAVMRKDPEELFPTNPFPGAQSRLNGEKALSQSELKRLADVLKSDLVAIYQDRFIGPPSQAMGILMLLVSMRTGLNLTPLIEMDRNCLAPHPFMPNMQLLNSFKRRGQGAQKQSVRQTALYDVSVPVRMDCVGILQMALARSEKLVPFATKEVQGRIWLYTPGQNGRTSEVTAMTPGAAATAFSDIAKRHGLISDNGNPMRVTPAILRKTMENRLWDLTDGDLPTVASVMGHTQRVADNHYLAASEQTKGAAAQFLGTIFLDALRNPPAANTPSGRCNDTLYGDLAPKDGQSHCEQFIHCLGCPSYAIVGTEKDLHRLFSFQVFLTHEMKTFNGEEWDSWRESHQQMITLIDDFTQEHFDQELVARAKAQAAELPHAFWAIKMRSVTAKREAA